MALDNEEEDAGGIPEWVVTFGDMMSLLLTFFIMLVSMSEIKQQEQYQALVESLRRRFGHDASLKSITPGSTKTSTSHLKKLATMGRAQRANIMRGGDKVRAPVGDHPHVIAIRPGKHRTIGGVVYFEEDVSELSEKNKYQLQIAAKELGGKSQKIEIRGHTSRKPISDDSPYRDNWDLAYSRCRKVMEFMVQLGIDPRRIRIAVAGKNEPVHLGFDAEERKKNSRVEVSVLDERIEDLDGTIEEKFEP